MVQLHMENELLPSNDDLAKKAITSSSRQSDKMKRTKSNSSSVYSSGHSAAYNKKSTTQSKGHCIRGRKVAKAVNISSKETTIIKRASNYEISNDGSMRSH